MWRPVVILGLKKAYRAFDTGAFLCIPFLHMIFFIILPSHVYYCQLRSCYCDNRKTNELIVFLDPATSKKKLIIFVSITGMNFIQMFVVKPVYDLHALHA